MKRVLLISIAAACLASSAACGGGSQPAGGAQQTLRFAVIPKSLDLPVFDYAKTGAEREAKQLGNVQVLWNGPTNADQLKQKEILESFITQRVDGIAISCLNGPFLADSINRAIDAGIPVVTWDSDAPTSKRIAFYGVDDYASGRIMAEEAVKLLGGKGKVAIITSVGATNLQRRLDGVRDVLSKNPGIQIVEVYDIKEDPDLAAWISVGGWPVFTRNALDPINPAKTKFISFDTNPPAPDLLKAGKVQILLGQKYFGWGSEAVKLLYDIKHGKMPSATIIDSGVDVVTKENVDDYVAKWKKLESGS
ncbi:MAG: ABC transporter substrate-binding protein [Acidobacteria bacterium]|nr:MAG: ABC transporter substrate-binding protein [Acidobacteriota bacterium]